MRKKPSLKLATKGLRNPKKAYRYIAQEGYLHYLNKNQAKNVFDRNWDILVVLDACRVDLLESVSEEYSFIEDIEQMVSVGSQSEEWMEKTFTSSYADMLSNTVVVTGNPYSKTALDTNKLEDLDEVWRYVWDEDIGSIKARPITDRAITHWRDLKPDRLIVHYMQPHFPCIPEPRISNGPIIDDFGNEPVTIWSRLKNGELSREEVWDAALRNLRYVLNDVELLLNNVSASTVAITSDHGDAYGENDVYGHPRKSTHDKVKRVPWVETTAVNSNDYQPDKYTTTDESIKREEQLRALGYR